MRRTSIVRHIAQNIVLYAASTAAVGLLGTLALIYYLGWGF